MSSNTTANNTTANINTINATDKLPGEVKTILAILVSTTFVMMLNETTVAVALPSIMASFAISATTGQWLLTGFMLTMAIILPTTGWMLERFTTRALFIFATVIFLIGTILAAIAPTFLILLTARIAQAIGTAVIMPLLTTVAITLVPAPRRGTIMGIIAVVMAAGPALGPTVAGAILNFGNWHWIFWSMVPLVAIATLLGVFKLTNTGAQRTQPLDVLSVALSVFAFGGLIYGLSSIEGILNGGEEVQTIYLVLGIGVVGLALFIWRQLVRGKTDGAMLDLKPFIVRNFTLSIIVLMGLMAALLGVLNTLPLYFQGSLLVTALVTGLAFLPGGLLEAVLSPLAGLLFDKFGPRPLIAPGMVIVTASLFWLSTVDEQTTVWLVIVIHVIFSVGLAMLFGPVMTTALGSLPAHLYNHGSAILITLEQLAGAAGTAGMIAVYSTVSNQAKVDGAPETVALANGASSAFLASAILAGITFIVAMFITRPEPETEQELSAPTETFEAPTPQQ